MIVAGSLQPPAEVEFRNRTRAGKKSYLICSPHIHIAIALKFTYCTSTGLGLTICSSFTASSTVALAAICNHYFRGSLSSVLSLPIRGRGFAYKNTAKVCAAGPLDPCSSSPATTTINHLSTTAPPQYHHSSECPPLLAKPHRGDTTVDDNTYQRDSMPHTVGGPPPTAARQGREQQKYTENGARCVAGCIPIRFTSSASNNNPSGAASARVLMITSRNGKGYVFPKGGWEVDESVEVAAQRETVEEAGVRGELELPMLGTFAFRSGKAERQNACAMKGRCVAYMFAMRVSEELDVWPEVQQRHRVWVGLKNLKNSRSRGQDNLGMFFRVIFYILRLNLLRYR